MCLVYTPSKPKEVLVFDILWLYTKKNKCPEMEKKNSHDGKGMINSLINCSLLINFFRSKEYYIICKL